MKNEISVFWPRNRTHTVSTLTLDLGASGVTGEMARHIAAILKLTQAMRGLQPMTDPALRAVSDRISRQIADELEHLAKIIKAADSARGLVLRAQILRGGEKRQLATEVASLNEQQLIGFCGDLTTWLGKSRQTYFSAFFAVPDTHHQGIADEAHALLPDAFANLCDMVDERLVLSPVSEFKLSHPIAVAGEANLYPKHFAYFLPEDEGIKYATCKRTVVFANTLLEHGYAKFDATDSRVAISSADMIAGMTTLAKELSRAVLNGNLTAAMDFASRNCPHLNRSAHDRITSLVGRSVHTLDYVQPIFQYQDFLAA